MIAFGVCVGNEGTYKRHALPSISALAEPDTMLLSSRHNTSIFEAYNEMLEYLSDKPGLEALVLLHEDVELRDRRLLEKIRACLEMPDVAVAGVIGASGVTSLAWWEGTGRGRCAETRGLIDFGGGTHDVEAVDGLLMVLSPWAVGHVVFDADRYTGFHGYDVDYCFSARHEGARVIVTDIDLFHFTKGGFGDAAQYQRSNAIFVKKWCSAGGDHADPDDGTRKPVATCAP
jgi:hypothetical protein